MIIVVSGASGFIGHYLCAELKRRGHEVRVPGRLPDQVDENVFKGVEAVIHAAYSTRAASQQEAERTNIEGSVIMLALARRHGAHFTFISSMAAQADGPSYYSRSKFIIEKKLDLSKDLIVRPGLVIGAQEGLFGRMMTSLKVLPFVPILKGGQQPIYTIAVSDLVQILCIAIEQKKTGLLLAAHSCAISYQNFYRGLGKHIKKKIYFIPIPFWPTVVILQIVEKLGVSLPITSENILGIQSLRENTINEEGKPLGIAVRSFDEVLNGL